MAQKGINTLTVETKKNILNAVNTGLEQGLPISIVGIIMEGIMSQINPVLNETLNSEMKAYKEATEVESEQVEYNPEMNNYE